MKRVGLMAVFAFFLAVISAQGADIMKGWQSLTKITTAELPYTLMNASVN